MPSLRKILTNIDRYTPEQLAQFVTDGDCTIYQLNKTGHISPLTKRRIEQLVASGKTHAEQPADPEPEAPRTEIIREEAAAGPAVPPPPPPHCAQPSDEPKTTIIGGGPGRASGASHREPVAGYADEPQTPRPRRAGMPPDIPPVPPDSGGDFGSGHVIRPVTLFD